MDIKALIKIPNRSFTDVMYLDKIYLHLLKGN